MFRLSLIVTTCLVLLFSSTSYSESDSEDIKHFKKSKDFKSMIPIEVLEEIPIPKGYHEGLLVEKNKIFINNGEKGNTWILDVSSKKIISEIKSLGTFSEGIAKAPNGKYWITDWDTKKLYLARIENDSMINEKEISFDPSHPVGIVWNGENLYLITWTRGVGTKYHLRKISPLTK